MSELEVILKEQNVAKANAEALIEAFGAPFTEAGEILKSYKEIVVTDKKQLREMSAAREKRLILKKIRVGVENKRKELKEDALRTGKAIDGVAKYIKETILPAEEYLELQENFAKLQAEKEAQELLQTRMNKIDKYSESAYYNLAELSDEQFETLLAEVKKKHEDDIKAEKEAEAKRLADIEAEKQRQIEIEKENARLKKEAELAEIEREKERAAERKVQEAKDAEIEAERKKRQEIEKAEADRKAKEYEEQRLAKEAEDKKLREELLAPDKDKLIQFSRALDMIRTEKLPAVKSNQAQELVNYTRDELKRLAEYLTNKAGEL